MRTLFKYLIPFAVGCIALLVPLLRDLHFESALLAAALGCFWSGWKASKAVDKLFIQTSINILGKLYLAGLPLLIFSLITGCFSWHGLGFWILYPMPSVFFGTAIGRFFNVLKAPYPIILALISIFSVGIGVFFYEFFTLPQVYFFNHVWGGWPGPIYDESVTISWSLVSFRLLTFLWILLLWLLPDFTRSKPTAVVTIVVIISIGWNYTQLPEQGIATPRTYLKETLTSHFHTDHFDFYADTSNFTKEEIEYWALRHEFHFQQIIDTLNIDWPEERRIESFLYANAWQKKELVGAKFTSYVPVWLEQDQLHIAKQHLEGVLKHEIVHVISKQFGNRFFNASWSIGLVEGLAEAIAKDASSRSTLDQIMAAEKPYPTVEQMKASLTLSGFYSGASSVSYTTAGSFVGYLLEEYPVEQFKQAYSKGDFEECYEISLDSLVNSWLLSLPEVQTDSVDQQVANYIFSQRSIFQKKCPHKVSPLLSEWDQLRFYESNENSRKAFEVTNVLHEMAPDNALITQRWVHYQLEYGNYEPVIDTVTDLDSIDTFRIYKADAVFLHTGKIDSALSIISKVESEISREIRPDSLNWRTFLNARYKKELPDSLTFSQLNLPVQLAVTGEALSQQNSAIISYSSILKSLPLSSDWFEIYLRMTDRLVYLDEFDAARFWIEEISKLDLRLRYQERLAEQREWLNFNMILDS